MKLFDYAYCSAYKSKLSNLAILSPEKWSFGEDRDNGILNNYIAHTFERVSAEGKIFESDQYALFNTGLFDQYYGPIYALFTPNTNVGQQKWELDGFYTEYQVATMGVTCFPERANYFDDPAELVFDTHLDIVPQYDHIFGDAENIQRLPASVRNSAMRKQLFDGALMTTKRMLEANYKTAIPQFYRGKMQLLIPLCLQTPGIPDLALTCMKTEDKSKYIGSTCLTMEMAYNNARLIAKPESSWLRA